MRLLICAAIAVTGAGSYAAPAFAQEVSSSWSPAEMKSIITDLKGKVTAETRSDDNHPEITAASERGLKFDVYGAECEKIGGIDRCRGAELVTVFNLGDPKEVTEALQDLDYAAVSIYDDGNGDLKITRYVIFDEGITRGNMRVNVQVFLNISHAIWDKLDKAGYFKKK